MYYCSNLILSGDGDSDISSGNLPGESVEAWSDNNLDHPAIIDWTQNQLMKPRSVVIWGSDDQGNTIEETDSLIVMLEDMLERGGGMMTKIWPA